MVSQSKCWILPVEFWIIHDLLSKESGVINVNHQKKRISIIKMVDCIEKFIGNQKSVWRQWDLNLALKPCWGSHSWHQLVGNKKLAKGRMVS